MNRTIRTNAACLLALLLLVACEAGGTGDDGADAAGADASASSDTGAAADAVSDIPPADANVADTVPPDAAGADDAGADGVAPDAAPDGAAGDAGADAGPVGAQLRCFEGDLLPFHGVLHAHSTISDGAGPPEEAFAYARDEGGLDIMVLTDHMEVMVGPTDELAACRVIADGFYDPGLYLTDCGYEFATSILGRWGHNNVYFAPDLFRLTLEFADFYEDLAACEACVGQFNHPADKPDQTWFDFAYDAPADAKLNLMEFNTGADAWALFFEALDAGWHVSPTVNQDNHDADWGTRDDRRTGFWMTDLTREALADAMRARRSFMSDDANATIRMQARVPADDVDPERTCWMGSILAAGVPVTITVTADDEDGEPYDRIELYGAGATSIETFPCDGAGACSAETAIELLSPGYVVARAVQADGDLLVAAPIWFAP